LFLDSLFDAGEPLATFLICVDWGFRWAFFDTDFKQIERQAAALGPFNCVESEIVAKSRIGAGVYQQSHEIGVTEDDGEDQRRLPAVVTFVDVRAAADGSFNGVRVTRSYCLGKWYRRTHYGGIITFYLCQGCNDEAQPRREANSGGEAEMKSALGPRR
jgi:hypothetical protein